jgi:hypothetical protein
MNPALQHLLQRPDLWRPRDRRPANCGVATGFIELDRVLYGGGWPRAALTELLLDDHGVGELRLLTPLLAALTEQQLWQVWINPPFIPYAPALVQHGIDLSRLLIVRTTARQQLWACEQALRSAACGAVLYWPGTPLRYGELRKLQVAAGAHQCMGFLLRATRSAQHTSPAALRLQLQADASHLQVRIMKQRGGNAGQQVSIPCPAALQIQASISERPAISSNTVRPIHTLITRDATALTLADTALTRVALQ